MARDFPSELGQAMWRGFLLTVWQVSVVSCSCNASGELGEYLRRLEAGVQLLRNEPVPEWGPEIASSCHLMAYLLTPKTWSRGSQGTRTAVSQQVPKDLHLCSCTL